MCREDAQGSPSSPSHCNLPGWTGSHLSLDLCDKELRQRKKEPAACSEDRYSKEAFVKNPRLLRTEKTVRELFPTPQAFLPSSPSLRPLLIPGFLLEHLGVYSRQSASDAGLGHTPSKGMSPGHPRSQKCDKAACLPQTS